MWYIKLKELARLENIPNSDKLIYRNRFIKFRNHLYIEFIYKFLNPPISNLPNWFINFSGNAWLKMSHIGYLFLLNINIQFCCTSNYSLKYMDFFLWIQSFVCNENNKQTVIRYESNAINLEDLFTIWIVVSQIIR